MATDFDFITGDAHPRPAAMPYPSLVESMNVNLVVNDTGKIFILHDKKFPCVMNWVEYDTDSGQLALVAHDGTMIDFGMIIQSPIRKRMMNATDISTLLVGDNRIDDFYIMPLIIR